MLEGKCTKGLKNTGAERSGARRSKNGCLMGVKKGEGEEGGRNGVERGGERLSNTSTDKLNGRLVTFTA